MNRLALRTYTHTRTRLMYCIKLDVIRIWIRVQVQLLMRLVTTLAHLNCIGSVEKWRSFQSKVVRNQSVEPSARLEEMVLSAAGVDQLLARRHSATFQDLKTHKWTHYSYRRSTRIGLRTIRRSDCFKRVCARTSFVHSILVLVTLLLYTKVVQKWFAINS